MLTIITTPELQGKSDTELHFMATKIIRFLALAPLTAEDREVLEVTLANIRIVLHRHRMRGPSL